MRQLTEQEAQEAAKAYQQAFDEGGFYSHMAAFQAGYAAGVDSWSVPDKGIDPDLLREWATIEPWSAHVEGTDIRVKVGIEQAIEQYKWFWSVEYWPAGRENTYKATVDYYQVWADNRDDALLTAYLKALRADPR